MKKLITILAVLLSLLAKGQTYDPTTGTVTNKPLGLNAAAATDSRSYFYSTSTFSWRPYQSRAEILSYLNLAKYRTGQFDIIMDSASQRWVLYFRNGTTDNDLVYKIPIGNDQWKLIGNLGTVDVTNFLGTRDNIPLTFKVNNFQSGRIDNTNANTFFGYRAGGLITSANNTAIGYGSLLANSSGGGNTSVGTQSLFSSTFGNNNTSVGYNALSNNTAGGSNTVIGYNTALGITTGSFNTVVGANVTGLSASLSNNIIIADGQGNKRLTVDDAGTSVLVSTTALGLPTGNTAQRPSSPITGYLRYNTDSAAKETYNGSIWVKDGSGGGGGSGTVANVATGLFLSGGPITTTGTIIADSAAMAGYFLRRKDSSIYWPKYRADTSILAIYNALAGKQATGNYITATTGDVVATGPGSVSATIQANAVTTTKIINSAVTLPKLANGTANSLIGYNGSGVPAVVTAGTNITISGNVISAAGSSGCNWPVEARIDTIYSRNQWFTFDGLTPTGGITLVKNNGTFYTSGGNGSYGNYITIGPNESYEDYVYDLTFTLQNAGSNFGIAIGTKYQNGANTADMLARLTTGVGAGNNIYISRSIDGLNFTTGPSNITLALNDVINLKVTYRNHVFSVQYTNITSGQTTSPVTFTLTNAQSGIPAMGKFALYEFSGTHLIQSIKISSNVVRNPNVMYLGDSKTAGFNATTFANRYADLLNATYPSTAIIAGGGNTTLDLGTMLQQVYFTNGRIAVMNIGSNDIRNGRTVSQTMATYDSIVSLLTIRGISVYHIVMPEDSTGGGTGGGVGLTALKNTIAATYPSTYIPNVWNEMSVSNVLKSAYNGGDGIHPNDAGNAAAAADVIASGMITTCTSRIAQIGTTDNIIQRFGDSIWLSPSYRVYIDSIARAAGSAGSAIQFTVTSNTNNFGMKWTGINSVGNSLFQDDGTNTAIGTTPGTYKFKVNGDVNTIGMGVYTGATNGLQLFDRSTANAFAFFANGDNLNIQPSTLGFSAIQFSQAGLIYGQGLDINGKSAFLDTGKVQARFSYFTNIHSTFTRYSLIDKAYADSAIAKQITDSLSANTFEIDNPNLGDTLFVPLTSASARIKSLIAGTGVTFGVNDSTITINSTAGSVAGSNTQVQYNNSGAFGAEAAFAYDQSTNRLTAGEVTINGSGVDRIFISGNNTGTMNTIHSPNLTVEAMTNNDATTSGSGTITNAVGFNYFGLPTLTATNSSITYTDVSNVKIEEPVAGTNITISRSRSLYAKGIGYIAMSANEVFEDNGGTPTLGKAGHYIFTGTTATATLPDLATYKGGIYFIKNAGSGNLTLQRAGSDQIYDTSAVTSIIITAGSARVVVAGTSFWFVE